MEEVFSTMDPKTSVQATDTIPPAFLVIAGDLSYADGSGHKWDEWGEMMSPYLSELPLCAIPLFVVEFDQLCQLIGSTMGTIENKQRPSPLQALLC